MIKPAIYWGPLLVAAVLYSAPATAERPIETIGLGRVGGHNVEFLLYGSGASRCQARTLARWNDGVSGSSGVEIHFDAKQNAELTYFISKATWSMHDRAEMRGELRFSTGPSYRVDTDAVGQTLLRIRAPLSSFPHWREALRAHLSLESGFSASWTLEGTNAAGAAILRCVDAVDRTGGARRTDPMAPRGGAPRSDPMAGTRNDSWINKSD